MKQYKKFSDIESVKDAIEYLGIKEDPFPHLRKAYEFYPAHHRASNLAHDEIVLVIEAANNLANGGKQWIPNFDDGTPKWQIWWESDGSGGLRLNGIAYWYTTSTVGPRLCFFSKPVAQHVLKILKKNYAQYIKY